MDITDPEGRSVITILTTLIMLSVTSTSLYLYSKYGIHLTRLEMLTSRHLLIRFNRVTQQVHLHRPKYCGGIVTFQERLLANADRWQLKPGKRPEKKPRKTRRFKSKEKPAAPTE